MIENKEKSIVYVYTTCSNKEEAKKLCVSAIKEKLAIPTDYWVVNSTYPWDGVIKEINQYMIMFSTQMIVSEKLIKHLESIHPYLIPIITRSDTSMSNQQCRFWADSFFLNKSEFLTENELKAKKNSEETAYMKLK